MASYEQIRTYFERSEILPAVARAAASVPIVQGFTLDVDPLWSFLYDIENDLADWTIEAGWSPTEWHKFLDDYTLNLFRHGLSAALYDRLQFWSRIRYQGYRSRDLYKPVKAWSRLQASLGTRRSSPVVLTVVHRPLRAPAKEILNEEPEDQAQLRRLFRLVREFRAQARIEERPVARLAFAAGDGIYSSRNRFGTLGGVLNEPATGKSYGVTCAHVAACGDSICDASGTLVGICTADVAPVALRQGTICDPVNLTTPNPAPGNGPDLNMLDSALIDLTLPIAKPQLAGVAPSLSQGQNVTLRGASTGITQHKLGSLCLSYSFHEGGQEFCFRDAIEIWPVSWSPFGGTLGRITSFLPKQGDSGGWVLTDDQPAQWAGVFFGEDGQRGFAIRASWVHSWAEKSLGAPLNV